MTENPKLEKMDLERISVSHQSFAVDVERLSHIAAAAADTDGTGNSRFTLQRSLSRKGHLQRANDKKMNNERETSNASSASPRASTLAGATTPEKSMVVTVGTTDQALNPQVHHQITILAGNTGGGGGGGGAESRLAAKRYSFRRSSAAPWTFNPRRILVLFATLSSIGSILLIYFTLSAGKLNGEESALNS